MGINVGKALKEVATNKNTIEKEVKQLGRGLGSGADPAKALEAFKKNNKDNPAVLRFMEGLDAEIPNNPTAIQVGTAIDSRLKKYAPLDNDPMRIVTNSGVKTIIPKDLSPEAIKAITKLHGEPKLWNRNKGVSIGDVDNIYDPNIADTLVAGYNAAIKNPEILELLKGKPFNKDLAGKIIYNGLASASWGSAGYDTAEVFNRFNGNSENGNSDSIWKSPYAAVGAAVLARAALPMLRRVPFNLNALGKVVDIGVPAALAKGVKYATTSNEVKDNSSNTDSNKIPVDALNNSNNSTSPDWN